MECARAERSGRTFFLLLVDLTQQVGMSTLIDPQVASQLFAGLGSFLRQTDFVGWHRQGRVVGAVLAESPNPSRTDVALALGQRMTEAVETRVHSRVVKRLRVRLYEHPHSDSTKSVTRQLELSRLQGQREDI